MEDRTRSTSVAVFAATLTGASGLIVLVVGWWFGVDIVTRVVPGLVSMKANTAVGFLLLGAACHPRVQRRAAPAAHTAGALAAAIGGLTIFQYLVGVDLGIDQLLADDPNVILTASPGRMGLNSATGFSVLGVSAALVGPGRGRRSRTLGQAGGIAVLLLSTLALLGYVLGASSAVGLGSATAMALHTSVLFIVASFGLLASTVDVGVLAPLASELQAGRTARQVLPAVAAGLVASVLLTSLLAVTGVVDDQSLQLALQSTLALTVAALAILVVLAGTVRSQEGEASLRRDLDAVRSAFPDVHLRIGIADEVLAVHGPTDVLGLRSLEVGTPVQDSLHASAVAAILPVLADVRATGWRRTVSFPGPRAERTHEAQLVPFTEDEVAVAIRDITELAETQRELTELTATLEQQVRDRTAELARANSDLERFAYLASHDLQEPLRMVTGFVSRIADRYGDLLDERGRQYVHYAVDGAERMQQLIEGLLAYSRAGHLEPGRVGRTDLADLVEDIVAVQPADGDGRFSLHLDPVHVHGDPVLLRQVVQNLVANALKFRRPGVTPVVRIGTSQHRDQAILWVQDNGIGIPPEHRASIFEMFRRFSPAPEHRGTGIGLSLVQQIVRAHGGRVDVSDAPAQGTRFTVTLPIAQDPT